MSSTVFTEEMNGKYFFLETKIGKSVFWKKDFYTLCQKNFLYFSLFSQTLTDWLTRVQVDVVRHEQVQDGADEEAGADKQRRVRQ